MKTRIKVGKKVYTIDETDIILDNGACYQILSRNNEGKYYLHYNLSKKVFQELVKKKGIYTDDMLHTEAIRNHGDWCTYWKFKIEYMINYLGYEEIVKGQI